MVASRAAGLRAQIDDGVHGKLIDSPEDPDELAAALGNALADPLTRTSVGRNARRRVGERYLTPPSCGAGSSCCRSWWASGRCASRARAPVQAGSCQYDGFSSMPVKLGFWVARAGGGCCNVAPQVPHLRSHGVSELPGPFHGSRRSSETPAFSQRRMHCSLRAQAALDVVAQAARSSTPAQTVRANRIALESISTRGRACMPKRRRRLTCLPAMTLIGRACVWAGREVCGRGEGFGMICR